MIFRYGEYRSFLEHARARCRVTPLGEWQGGPALILRHDVDLEVAPAHRLAALERECGVRSTFFFLVSCDSYNPQSARSRALLREMADWGFEVGLHFDPTVHPDGDDAGLRAAAEREAAQLADVVGRPVRSVSIHNPTAHGRYPLFEGFANAYDPAIFNERVYLSDSRMQFRRDPRDLVALASEQPAQLLTHPIHFTESGEGYDRIMTDHLLHVMERIDRQFLPVNATYRDTVRPDLRGVLARRLDGGGAGGHP